MANGFFQKRKDQGALSFRGILGDQVRGDVDPAKGDDPGQGHDGTEPAFFADLNLDQVVESIVAGYEEYELKPFFYHRAGGAEAIQYRHEVLRDLEDETLLGDIMAFAQRMRDMRGHLAQAGKLHHKHQQQRWFLDAVEIYCDAVGRLASDLWRADLTSQGFRSWREHLSGYLGSAEWRSLAAETKRLEEDLSKVTYCVHVKGNRVTVRPYDSEVDYSSEVQATFERFKQGGVQDYLVDFSDSPVASPVEAKILDLLAVLFDEVFSALDDYCGRHGDFLDATIQRFDREVHLYLAYLDYIAPLRAAGLNFCHPDVSGESKEVFANDTFDVALATKLVRQRGSVVGNDFHLRDPERILVVSGPNQGGKTTFARTFGQLHHLASIGLPVPGRQARLFLFDKVFTHFERQDDLAELSGQLEDDLVRMRDILTLATPDSIVIANEPFFSTTLRDSLFLGTRAMERIIHLDLLCVWVTFVEELASLGESVVSMVTTVVPGDPSQRTYKVVRRPADGLSYAISIAEKYGLTYEVLKSRIAS